MKDLTVYVMTHNRPNLVLNTINSVLNQTCHDFKFIVSDNSDNNDTYELLKKEGLLNQFEYRKRPPSEHQFFICIEEVETSYFMLFHDDDIMYPFMIEEMYKVIQTDKYQAVACNADFLCDNVILSKQFFSTKKDVIIGSPKEMVKKYLEFKHAPFPAYMYKKDVYSLRFDAGKYSDVTSLLHLAEKGKIYWIAKPLMAYRFHSGQSSHDFDLFSQLLLINHFKKFVGKSKRINLYRFNNIQHYAKLKGHKLNVVLQKKYSNNNMLKSFFHIMKYVFTHSPWKIVAKIKQKIDDLHVRFLRVFIRKDLIVMRIDGGICSQMYQYAYGQLLANRMNSEGKNVVVKYDVSWFDEFGYDLLGEDKRLYDLEMMFPYLKVQKATKKELMVYKCFYETSITDFRELLGLRPPLCLEKYYYGMDDFWKKYSQSFFVLDPSILDEKNKSMLKKIKSCRVSCGVHVRRGDLGVPEIAKKSGYGTIVQPSYFESAVAYIKKIYDDVVFFLFSDRIEYVKTEILPLLTKSKIEYILVDINSPDSGYMDLFLMSNCNHQIASIGSQGYVSYSLNHTKDKILVTSRENCFSFADKAVLLDINGGVIKEKL